jgi:hypothetical protein
MTGSHEVRGSIPLGSTNTYTDLSSIADARSFRMGGAFALVAITRVLSPGFYSDDSPLACSPLCVSFCCAKAAVPNRPPIPIDSTAVLGTIIIAPFSFSPS